MVLFVALGCANNAPPVPADDSWLNDWKSNDPAEKTAVAGAAPISRMSAARRSNVIDAAQDNAPSQHSELRSKADRLDTEDRRPAAQIADATKGGWTGAVIYAWPAGCIPCERLKRDIASRKEWKVGTSDDCHFKIVSVGSDTTVPLIVYFVDGKEIGRIVGYDGSSAQLNAILAKHPMCSPDLKGSQSESMPSSSAADALYENRFGLSESYGAFVAVPRCESPIIYSTPVPARFVVPYRSSISWGICGVPLLTHTHQGACDPVTGTCY
jgi:hypothetical protein